MLRRLVLKTTYPFFIEYPENAKSLRNKNCESRSCNKTVGKLAYLGVKMTSLDQKHKNVMKAACLEVRKLRKS